MKQPLTPFLNAVSLSLLLGASACTTDVADDEYGEDMDDVAEAQTPLKATGYYCNWVCNPDQGSAWADAGCAGDEGDSTFSRANVAVAAILADDDACGSGLVASDVVCSANAACS